MQAAATVTDKIRLALRLDRAVGFVWAAAPRWTAAGAVLVAVQGVLPLLTLYLIKLIVDAVAAALAGGQQAFGRIGLLIAAACGAALLEALGRMLAGVVQEAQNQAVSDHMFDVLHEKSVAVDYGYYENPSYFDTLHRAQQEGPFRPALIVNSLLQLGRSGVSLTAMAALLFAFHWAVALLLLAAVVPGLLVRLRHSHRLHRWRYARTPDERRAFYYNRILTGDGHAKELRLFDLGRLFSRRFRELRRTLREEKLDLARRRAAAEFAAQALALAALFAALAFIALRTAQGALSIGSMVMYFQAVQRSLGFFRELLGGLADLYENNLFLTHLYEFLDLAPKVADPPAPRPVPRPMRRGFEFRAVGFGYPSGERAALEDVSLALGPGEVVALVGPNGSGKTTLVKLLCRLYDPGRGTVTLDGEDLRGYAAADVRRQISVIFQDYVRYHLSARENIRLGNVDLDPRSAAIPAAARRAGAAPVIEALPNGYDTVLGRWFEDGCELSIGEWQKMALARAFVRDAQLIVLDEPTSALDADSEYEVFRRFRALLDGRAALLISHRFSTVRMADRIHVFDRGRVVESGPHDALVRGGGMYAEMFAKQAGSYTG